MFAAHEDVLSLSPYFAVACRNQFLGAQGKRIDLPDEEPEIFSCVLEYLYVRRMQHIHHAWTNQVFRRATTTHVWFIANVETLGSLRMP